MVLKAVSIPSSRSFLTPLTRREKAMEIISESIEKTVAMHDPLNEVGRVLKELEQLGIFDTAVQQEDNKAKKL